MFPSLGPLVQSQGVQTSAQISQAVSYLYMAQI